MNTKLLFERGPLQLWRSDRISHFTPPFTRPSFTIMGPGIVEDFPAFDDPDNANKALLRLKELRAVFAAVPEAAYNLIGRRLTQDAIDPATCEVYGQKGDIITPPMAAMLAAAGLEHLASEEGGEQPC